jgi:hypothetical protein
MTQATRAAPGALLRTLPLLCLLATLPARAADAERPPLFGLMADLGAPDGFGVAGVVRPLDWLRLNAGLLTNTVGVGVRGGVSWLPLRSAVTPSLNLDLGRYFDGDYSGLADRLGVDTTLGADEVFEDVGYTFWSATVGLELGASSRFAFFLRAGYARWYFDDVQAQTFLRNQTGNTTLTTEDVSVSAGSPAFKLGVLLYLF